MLSVEKTEFGNFSRLLQKAQNNIQTGLNQLEERAIEKRLKEVETISDKEVRNILPGMTNDVITGEE